MTTSGPYAFVRNPLYLGTLLAALGCTLAAAQPGLAAMAGAVFFSVYQPVMEQEEQRLAGLFPEYEAYAATVPQLVPRIPRQLPSSRASRSPSICTTGNTKPSTVSWPSMDF